MINFIKEYGKWILLLLVIIFIAIRTKKKGYFFKVRKTGEQLKFKDFMNRWKKGVEGITPLQITKSQISGNYIIIVGLISGFVTMCVVRMNNIWWWAAICLGGGLFLQVLSQIGNYQKYFIQKRTKDMMDNLIAEKYYKDNYEICVICGKKECPSGICDECLKDVEIERRIEK